MLAMAAVIPPQRPDPYAQRRDPLAQLGRGAIWRAESVLALRQWAEAFWPFALVFKLVLAAALLGFYPLLGPLVHLLLVVASAAALVASFVYSLRRYRGINEESARRAVERATGLQHRPLTTLADQPAIANTLWQHHRDSAARLVRSVSLKVPRLNLRASTAPALRYGSWVALIVAVLLAWDEAPRRLEEATTPPMAQLLPASKLDVWITPPAYTGQPPIALRADQRELVVPEGSMVSVRVTGGLFPPVLELPGGRERLKADGNSMYQLTAAVTQTGRLRIRQDGRYLGEWLLGFLQDMPPIIDFNKPPEVSDQKALRLDYKAADDIGLVKVEAEIVPSKVGVDSPHAEPLLLTLPLGAPPPQNATAFRFFDLTAHPLAGSSVVITLRAYDGRDQMGESDPITFTLPERRFNNPIARALIKLRREFLTRGLAARHPGVELISGLAEEVEEDQERTDFTGALALRSMAARLRLAQDNATLPGIEKFMWDVALHFEDGGNGQALQHLREAQQALEDALGNGAEDAEIQRLMQELQQAMDEYLNQMQQQGQMPQDGEQQQGQTRTLDRQDLQNMLDQMRQLAQSGSREQALEMLKQFQNMMENLRSQGQGGNGDPQLGQDMERLGDIAKQQQNLMQSQPQEGGQSQMQPQQGEGEEGEQDGPQQGQQQGQQNGMPGAGQQFGQQQGGGSPSQQQESLRRALGEVMQGLSERGYDVDELGKGERAMNGAREELEQGDVPGAATQQGQALEQLRRGMESLQQQAQSQQGNGNSDPFGRQQGNSGLNRNDIEIPDRAAADRARQVLEELRRRSGDYSRPEEERNYLDRLLKWF